MYTYVHPNTLKQQLESVQDPAHLDLCMALNKRRRALCEEYLFFLSWLRARGKQVPCAFKLIRVDEKNVENMIATFKVC